MDKIRIGAAAVVLVAGIFFMTREVWAAAPGLHGFAEVAYGVKASDDNTKRDDFNLLEQRLQIKTTYFLEGDGYLAQKGSSINVKGDFTVDEYFGGKTDFELREFNLSLTPYPFMDAKLGRQVLTWGTGDYLFINDMFPKDYESFYLGREEEYLKKPSDAVKVSFYPAPVNINFVMLPYFTPNTIATGDRLSFFDSFQGGIAGVDSDRHIISPPFQLSNAEYALRLYRGIGSNEVAFYYFRGFDKMPGSYKDETTRQLYHERLDVYGASLQGPLCSGIGNLEFGYSNSREDSAGSDRLIENSMLKTMAGYTKDLGNDFKAGFQYLYEQRLDYGNYIDNLLPGDFFRDESHHVVASRIAKLYKNQTVMMSLFTFYSLSDRDGYIRPLAGYDITDQWKVTFGANLPWGEDDSTEFGQMKRNKNVFVRSRYSF